MKITINHINNLLKLFESGLVNGAGHDVNHFCVQQAVHRVIDDDLRDGDKDAQPPTWCVKEDIVSFGISLNDQDWGSNKARAEGLKRFAIAELGSSMVKPWEFYEILAKKVAQVIGEDWHGLNRDSSIIEQVIYNVAAGPTTNSRLTRLANLAADTLMELGTEGSQFLYLLDEPDRKKREARARALGHKIYASQMADTASQCAWGVPAQRGKYHC